MWRYPKRGAGLGGAIYNAGTLSMTDCSMAANSVTGANGGDGQMFYILGNGGNGGDAWGGNVFSEGQVAVANCTLAAGGAVGGTNGVRYTRSRDGSPGSVFGGNIANRGGHFILQNTIHSSASAGVNGYTTGSNFIDAGSCLSSDQSVALDGRGSRINTDPQLRRLSNNGGPTMTMALAPGSPAIDAGDNKACPPTDQRGFPRPLPLGGTCDIGAYESGWMLLANRSASNGIVIQAWGPPGQRCRWLAGTTLSNLVPIATNTVGTNGVILLQDPSTPALPIRFYKLAVP